ncbi:phosphatidate cytidylyltransferase [Ammoniphilus resinae]|uniref:Phosphatidate cytidylyltransferase n=1 Tax=Ammoniphilus resinae TaxID=861532 RepID=A0ABS4GMQ0_9BACL|nr:phosphatidate cytidylyltransferase [Ammoniphilus resinae]MBP1931524.1 phosphatidate cytidylyltransferase [Ammoniphilus resinae]
MKTRIVTGAIGGAVFLSLVYAGGIAFGILLFFIGLFGFYEWLKMGRIHIGSKQGIVGLIFTIYYLLPVYVTGGWTSKSLLVELIVLLVIVVLSKNKANIQEISYVYLGSIYLGVALHYMNEARLMENGLTLTLVILIAVWTTDTAAYFVGKAFGKHKLWPAISPNKTVEGSVGAIVFAVLTVVLFAMFSAQITVPFALLLALAISIGGQIGDLVESAVKRTFDVKDSGQILPGHGGVLDRFDSLLFVFILLHLLSLI